jgi:uncharacterized protein YkwD
MTMRSLKHALPFALALLALAACATGPKGPPAPPNPASQMPALEKRIMTLVEQERMKIDPAARPLAADPELAKVARARAKDMAAKHYLAHAAPNGDTSASLLMAQDEKFQGLLGENLAAQHYTRQLGVTVDAFARRFLDTWLNSPPHRENMAFAQYDRAGVGAAVNGDTVYVALLFATDMGLPPHKDSDGAATITRFDTPRAASAEPGRPAVPPIRLRGALGVAGGVTGGAQRTQTAH